MPDYRESLIRIDHGARIAEVWTQDATMKRKLARVKAKPLQKQLLGEWFELPSDRVRFLGPRNRPQGGVRFKKREESAAVSGNAG